MIKNINLRQITKKLDRKIKDVIWDLSYDGALLSGGVDSSIINYIASKECSKIKCITVGFEESSMKDLKYARLISDKLDIENHVRTFDFAEAKRVAKRVVEIRKSFDPMEIRNSIPIFIAISEAKKLGLKEILTGDGSDELFAGYSFLYELPLDKMSERLNEIWQNMEFSSQNIAESLGLETKLPFLSEEIENFAKSLSPELMVGKRKNQKLGKWILRKTYEKELPDRIIWRSKTPIEAGCGTAVFPNKFESEIDDSFFKSRKKEIKKEDTVAIRNKEQLFYYETYRSRFGAPVAEDPSAKTCPYCQKNVPLRVRFCKTCGNGIY